MKTIIDSFELCNSFREKLGQEPLTEKQYKIEKRKLEKVIKKDIEKIEYCEKNGHEDSGNGTIANGVRVYTSCSRCGRMYDRYLTTEESKKWYEMMNTPMTI